MVEVSIQFLGEEFSYPYRPMVRAIDIECPYYKLPDYP